MAFELVDQWSGSKIIATISEEIPPSLLGRFHDEETRFWNEAAGLFNLFSPPTVELDSELGVTLYGENTGLVNQTMYITIRVKDPEDMIVKTDSTTPRICTPGSYLWGGSIVSCDIIGDWTAEGELYGESGLLDTWQGKIGTVGVEVEKPSPWLWLGIGGIALGGLILLAPKKKV